MADHQLHPLVPGFASVADDYERGRPEYPADYIPAALELTGIPSGSAVLDLAAGTGKLTRALVAGGLDVVAVEPLPGMRARLAAQLPADRVLDGSAETIPLPAASVDAVFCGDAFHWFHGPAALEEIARVLRPGGALIASWLIPAPLPPDGWQARIADLLTAVRPEHPGFTPDRGLSALDADARFTPRRALPIPFEHTTDVEGFCAYVASFSFVGGMPPAERAQLLDAIRAVLAGEPLPLRAPSIVDAWVTTLRA